MSTKVLSAVIAALFLAVLASPAYAQYGATPMAGSNVALGEDYHFQVSFGLWNPTPDVVVSSSALGRVGSTISAIDDLGMEKKQITSLDFVLKPALKHKFRVGYTPLKWTGDKVVTRDIEFNAQLYRIAIPVQSELQWKEWSFGYEYDFVSNSRGFVGLILDVKYPQVDVSLTNAAVGTEFAQAKAPIPSIGGAARVYATQMVAIDFELTALKIPTIQDEYRATYIDWDLGGLVNFNRNFGAKFGYRSLNVDYLFELDTGDMNVNGFYFSGIARF